MIKMSQSARGKLDSYCKNQTWAEQSLNENLKQICEKICEIQNNSEKKGIRSTNTTKVTKLVNNKYNNWQLLSFSSRLKSEFEEKVNSTKRYCI